MIVAAISCVALIASIVLGVREILRGRAASTSPTSSDPDREADTAAPEAATAPDGEVASAAGPSPEETEAPEADAVPEEAESPTSDALPETASAPAPAAVPVRKSDIAWGVFFCLLELFNCVWSAIGLMQDDAVSAVIVNAVLTLCAWASFAHQRITPRLRAIVAPGGRFPHPLRAAVILVLIASALAVLGLEVPSNHNITWMYPLCLLLEYALVALVMTGLFFLAQRRAAGPAIAALLLLALGITEYFVILFRSTPIQPGDIFALTTAMNVSTGYVYTLTAYCLYGIGFAALAVLLCRFAYALLPAPDARRFTGARWVLVNVAVGLACIGAVVAHIAFFDYYNTLGIQVYTWRPLESYYRQGYLPAFISSAQTIIPPVPDNYDYDDAEELLAEYAAAYDESVADSTEIAEAAAQFEEEQPTVIAIMNETFSDLSIYQNLHADYEGPTYFNSISDALARGSLYVSAYGGGTCNTEFEFLTGNSMAYLGQGVYPYTIYDLSETDSLAKQFSELGYTTTAIHPNHATNWNRENVYSDLGFDEFLSIEDFEDADTLRGLVTDAATYDKILELLEEDDSPQFIFNVTMQNHSGYTTGLIPSDMQTDYLIDGTYSAEVNEYLALIEESDRALEEFLEALSELDRKVVVVFFGDHQPYFPDEYNDAWFEDEDDATHAERLWQTEYLIWANYDVAGNSQTSETLDISSNYLGAYLMQLIGAPLTDYQKARLVIAEAMPVINTTGYMDRSGTWYLTGTARSNEGEGGDGDDAEQARDDLETIQYYMLFGDGTHIFTTTLQAAANETNPNLTPGTTKIK